MPLLEYFDNSSFLAREIEIKLKNPSLMFQSIDLEVRSSLFGLRFVMREYFFTCIGVVTVWLSSLYFVSSLLTIYVIRHYFLTFCFAIQTCLRRKEATTPPLKQKKKKVIYLDEGGDESDTSET